MSNEPSDDYSRGFRDGKAEVLRDLPTIELAVDGHVLAKSPLVRTGSVQLALDGKELARILVRHQARVLRQAGVTG